MRRRSLLIAIAALLCLAAPIGVRAQAPKPSPTAASAAVFSTDGMWIWYLSQAGGGDVNKIAKKAKNRGIETLYIKSGDGSGSWSQFSSGLVRALRAKGLRVCGWQYVYGVHPKAEAKVGAAAVKRGAQCLVIDAESEYEGKYAQASTYITKLRGSIGAKFPLGLAAFPWVDYHPSFPYSVMMGPGGAEFNLPQLYWKAIGVSVDAAYAHTYRYNRVYERPIMPLGQSYLNPRPREIYRFRQLALAHGFDGVSWWSWQHTTPRDWKAIGRGVSAPAGYKPTTQYPHLSLKSQGDLVVWAQQLLVGGGYDTKITGTFGKMTRAAVREFQRDHHLSVTGEIAKATWVPMLDKLKPVKVRWTKSGASVKGGGGSGGGTAARAGSGGPLTLRQPGSAKLPARGYEIPRHARR